MGKLQEEIVITVKVISNHLVSSNLGALNSGEGGNEEEDRHKNDTEKIIL